MERSHFVTIPCRVCYAKTLILDDRRHPSRCGRCGAPYDPASEGFGPGRDDHPVAGRPAPRIPGLGG